MFKSSSMSVLESPLSVPSVLSSEWSSIRQSQSRSFPHPLACSLARQIHPNQEPLATLPHGA